MSDRHSDPSPWFYSSPPHSSIRYYGSTPESPMDISEEENPWTESYEIPLEKRVNQLTINEVNITLTEGIPEFGELKTQPNSPEEQEGRGMKRTIVEEPTEIFNDSDSDDVPLDKEPGYPRTDFQGNPLPPPVKQGEKTVSEYYDEFRASPQYQLYQLEGPQSILRAFLKGLRSGLRRQVELRMFWNIQEVIDTATQIERTQVRKRVNHWGPPIVWTRMIPRGRGRGALTRRNRIRGGTTSTGDGKGESGSGSEQPSTSGKS